MEGVEDIPGTALYEGIQWDWESFPEYLDALERMPRAIDIGAHVPHAALRAYVLGERAHADATSDEIEEMQTLLRASMEAGALGFSTGRTHGHRDIHGQPVPGTFAPVDELVALSDAMDEAGHGVFQLVPAGIGGIEGGDPEGSMDGELQWMLDLAGRTSNPITFLVMESNIDPDSWRPWFAEAHRVNAEGGNLRPQVASRCFGVMVGHQSRDEPVPLRAHLRTARGAAVRRADRAPARPERPRHDPRGSTAEQPRIHHLGSRHRPRARQPVPARRRARVRTDRRPERRRRRGPRRARPVGGHVRPDARRRRS